ncbi:hypothetical protein BC941DRAFT_411279 [Chlamydoabsidia padenii]|nr:hypothetical protein BC941DRAFT_411279 [Chlamydoabsidia padenii]
MIQKVLLYCTALIYLTYSLYLYSTEPIQTSEWTCYGNSSRSTICEFTHFCIDQIHGPFILSSSSTPPPQINLINSDKEGDMWFTPKVINSKYYRGKYRKDKDTLFVYGLYSPFHFSHYVYNGLIPLYSTIRHYTDKFDVYDTWLFRAKTFWNEHTQLDMSIWSSSPLSFHDIVLDKHDLLTENQHLPPYSIPMCFKRAIVGTGNQCSLWYCEQDIPHGDYMAFRDDIFRLPLTSTDPCLHSVITFNGQNKTGVNIGILNRRKSRHITNVPELVQAILQEIPNVSQIRLISFDEGCNIRSTAHLVEDVDVLIAPFGNGLGAGLFMKKKNAMVIAIDARWYSESWFYWPMTSIGIRLYSFQCDRPICQEYEWDLIKSLSPDISHSDALSVMMDPSPPGIDWSVYGMYQKEVSRRVDIELFIPFLRNKMATTTYDIADCGEVCRAPFDRNGFGGQPR